eukprot:12431484-Karenia_brevis.AAC.2
MSPNRWCSLTLRIRNLGGGAHAARVHVELPGHLKSAERIWESLGIFKGRLKYPGSLWEFLRASGHPWLCLEALGGVRTFLQASENDSERPGGFGSV